MLSKETEAYLTGQRMMTSSYYLDGVENGTKATAEIALSIIKAMESNWEQFQGLPTQEVLRVVSAAFEDTLKQSTEHMLEQTQNRIQEEIYGE